MTHPPRPTYFEILQRSCAEVSAWLLSATPKEVAHVWILIGLQGQVQHAELMLQAGYPVDTPDPLGCTALMCASASGHLTLVHWLLAHGADATRQYTPRGEGSRPPGDTEGALWWAVRDRHLDIVQALLPHIPAPIIDALSPSPLLLAYQSEDSRYLRALWQHGCTLDVRFEDGRPCPMHLRHATELTAEKARRQAIAENQMLQAALHGVLPHTSSRARL